jgi:hypothetical protein
MLNDFAGPFFFFFLVIGRSFWIRPADGRRHDGCLIGRGGVALSFSK